MKLNACREQTYSNQPSVSVIAVTGNETSDLKLVEYARKTARIKVQQGAIVGGVPEWLFGDPIQYIVLSCCQIPVFQALLQRSFEVRCGLR